MSELNFHTLDVFTDRIFGGNQLAVFPEAPELPGNLMQAIAREFNLSETVFVRPTKLAGATRKLRIFTPGGELPFAGHPTIGTAQLLVELGVVPIGTDGRALFAFEEGVGLVPVEVIRKAGGEYFSWLSAARLPECRSDVPTRDVLAALLGIAAAEIVENEHDAPCAWSAGVPYLLVPVSDRAALSRVSVDGARWRKTLGDAWARDIYVFCHEPTGSGVDVRARMFGPGVGIFEDPATGSAAAAFAGYLFKRQGGPGRWTIAQGVEMGRPSLLHLEALAENGRLQTVRVGGSAVRASSGTLRLPR